MIRPLRRTRGWSADARGSAALEFALIAPMMIAIFFGLVEVGQAVLAGRRTSHAASTVGDLIAQKQTVSGTDTADCFAAGVQMMAPLPTASLKMKVTSVTQQSNGKYTVDWSDTAGLPADTVGAVYAVPAGLLSSTGDSVIVTSAKYVLTQASNFVIPNGINYSRVTYSKPRDGTKVAHS